MTAAGIARAGLAAFVISLAAAHALQPELSPLAHQVSEYANGPAGAVAVACFLAWAVSLAATGAAVGHATASRSLPIMLWLAAAGMAMVACFPTQTVAGELPPGDHRTLTGQLHDVGSGTATIAILCAVLMSARAVAHRRFRALAIGTALVALAIDLGLLAVGPEVGGLRQRLLVGAACLWQAVLLGFIGSARTACEHPAGSDETVRDVR